MSAAKTSHHLRPIPRLLSILPSGGLCRLPQGTNGLLQMPPRVRLLERQHVADSQLPKRKLELPVFAVEGVRYHRPERDALLHGQLHQLFGYLQLGAEERIVLATLKVVRGGVRFEVHRIVHSLLRPQAAYAHHPVFGLADVGQPLPADVSGPLSPLAVAVLVYYQHAFLLRSGRGLSEQDLQPTLVNLLGVPPRFRRSEEHTS